MKKLIIFLLLTTSSMRSMEQYVREPHFINAKMHTKKQDKHSVTQEQLSHLFEQAQRRRVMAAYSSLVIPLLVAAFMYALNQTR